MFYDIDKTLCHKNYLLLMSFGNGSLCTITLLQCECHDVDLYMIFNLDDTAIIYM